MSGNYNRKKMALAGARMFREPRVALQRVSGVVTDDTFAAISGASVMEVGVSGKGGVTGCDGKYTVS